MPRKIFDIIPPGKSLKEEMREETKPVREPPRDLPDVGFDKAKHADLSMENHPPSAEIHSSEPRPKSGYKGVLTAFFLLALTIGAGILISFKIAKAEIKIWPKTEAVSLKTDLTVNEAAGSEDFLNKIIPGRIFEAEKTISQDFSSTGKIMKKSEGMIRLYNAYSTQPELWKEGTRFVSSEGKLFKSKTQVFVPGAEVKNEKINPSYIDIPVIADKDGADYNIGPSSFSIVSFRGTPRYTKFYGESSQPMAGGGENPQVTKEDLDNAEKILVGRIKSEMRDALKQNIPDDFIFRDDILETEILEKSPLAKEGAEAEKFTYQVKAKARTISFRKRDLESFAKEFILSQVDKGKAVYSESLRVDYSAENIDFNSKTDLSLNISAKVYPEIDIMALKKSLVGKSSVGAKTFLESYPQVDRTNIVFFPIWVKNIPENIDKISVEYPMIEK